MNDDIRKRLITIMDKDEPTDEDNIFLASLALAKMQSSLNEMGSLEFELCLVKVLEGFKIFKLFPDDVIPTKLINALKSAIASKAYMTNAQKGLREIQDMLHATLDIQKLGEKIKQLYLHKEITSLYIEFSEKLQKEWLEKNEVKND